jgi:hypothetical protein
VYVCACGGGKRVSIVCVSVCVHVCICEQCAYRCVTNAADEGCCSHNKV